LFRGFQPAAIAGYTAHSLSSVERYIADFARVVELSRRDYPLAAVCRITGLSPRVIRDYTALMQQYSSPAYRPVMQMLFQRFALPNQQKEAKNGSAP
jgi:hypothetical protein